MTRVRATDFRKNMSHYMRLANTEQVIITHRSGLSFRLSPERPLIDDDEYFSNSAVQSNIGESLRQIREGKTTLLSPNDVRRYLEV